MMTLEKRERRKRWYRFRIPIMIALSMVLAGAIVGIAICLFGTQNGLLTASHRAAQTADDPGTDGPSYETISNRSSVVNEDTDASESDPTMTGLRLSDRRITLELGKKTKITAELLPEGVAHTAEVTYRTSDANVISVKKDGTVTAVGPGIAYVKVTAGGFVRKCYVSVESHITKLYMGTGTLEINRGETAALELQIFPENTTDDRTAAWTSSDEKVVKVDPFGKVTGMGPGEAEVTATVGDHTMSRTVKVNVPVESIYFTTETLKIRRGDKVSVPVSFAPADATVIPEIIFSSSNEEVVRVDSDGTVKGVGAGDSRIEAKCGDLTTYMDITVVIPITGVEMYPNEVTIQKGDVISLQASVTPADTTEEKYIDWSSDNALAATVSGGTVTAVGAGDARIAAFHDDYISTCLVHVLSPLKGIYLNQYELNLIEGSTGGLYVGYDPEDTTDDRTVFWVSEDSSVATVSDGVVTAVSAGTCQIAAVVGNQKVTATVTVTPFITVESVSLNYTDLTFENIGDTMLISATVLPANANESVSFMTSNANVALVSSAGVVRAVGAGDCVITATCGSVTAQCNVHVNAANIVVVLDPGHSSASTGAYNETYGVREEIINLKVAQACREYLLANYAGVTVYLTREDGNPVTTDSTKSDLEARAQFAQDRGAAILVSMHFNASTNHNASGCVCYVSNQDNVKAASNALGNSILAEISARTGLLNRGCEWNNSSDYFDSYGNPLDYYAINRHCANRGIPGIIVEHCFMDYDTDFIRTDEALTTFGIADAVGIANYLGLQRK